MRKICKCSRVEKVYNQENYQIMYTKSIIHVKYTHNQMKK